MVIRNEEWVIRNEELILCLLSFLSTFLFVCCHLFLLVLNAWFVNVA